MLTVGSFLLTVELLYLQLTILAFLLTIGAFLLTALASLLAIGAFFAYSGKVRLIRALRDCKQRSLTVSKKAPTVSKKASPISHRVCDCSHCKRSTMSRAAPSRILLVRACVCTTFRYCPTFQGKSSGPLLVNLVNFPSCFRQCFSQCSPDFSQF